MAVRTWNEILDFARGFRPVLRAAKERLAGRCSWYPYETLANLDHLRPVFASCATPLAELAAGGPILDIGAGDGDLSFLLAAAGYEVHALDNPVTNSNGMQGLALLREELNSNVRMIEADLNAPLDLGNYPLIFCLGVLYHVKSPLQLLEVLTGSGRYCVLSTRVARQTAEGLRLEPQPVAYLLDDGELNCDRTNYWIFTPAGLRRLVRRAGWATLHTSYYGDTRTSNPQSLRSHDERAFCLLKNRTALATVELLAGWYEAEDSGWRWTRREFSASALVAESAGQRLQLTAILFISGETIARLGPVTLRCRADGCPLEPQTYADPGDVVYRAELPGPGTGGSVHLEFSLDKALAPSDADRRELGVIVHSIDVSAV